MSSRQRQVLCPRDERASVQNVQINPRTKAKSVCGDAGSQRYLGCRGLKGLSPRKTLGASDKRLSGPSSVRRNSLKLLLTTVRSLWKHKTLDPSQTVPRQSHKMKYRWTSDAQEIIKLSKNRSGSLFWHWANRNHFGYANWPQTARFHLSYC